MPPEEFDWSLGVEGDTSGVETTPVAERGAKLAEPNTLDVQSQLPDEQEDRTADGQSSQGGGNVAEAAEPGEGADDGSGDAQSSGEGEQHELILGKFKSPEELAKAYQELEAFKGQQGNEVGQLRDRLAQMEGYVQSIQQQTAQPQLTDDLVSQVDELAEQNPQAAAVWALENQPLLYNRVMQVWAATDSLSASRFENALMREQLKQEMQEQIETTYGPVRATVTEDAQARQFDSAWRNVSGKFPDFKQFETGLMDAAAAAPELAQALQSGDVASKERLIENLYWLTKGRQADTIAQAATDLGRRQHAETAAEKKSAAVASGSANQARGEKSAVEGWKEQFLAAPNTSIAGNLKEVSR